MHVTGVDPDTLIAARERRHLPWCASPFATSVTAIFAPDLARSRISARRVVFLNDTELSWRCIRVCVFNSENRGLAVSIKRRLFLLLLVALLPLLAFELLTQIHLRIEREAEIRQEATRLLDLLVTEQQRIVADIRGDLHTIADSGVARHGWADCQSFLDGLRRRYPGYLDIEVADTEGVIRCSTEAGSIGAAVADLRSFRDALRSGDLIVGAGERRPRRGVEQTTALPFRLGMTAPDGARAGVLTVHLDIHWLGEHLGRKPMPPNTAILLADSTGTVLARVPEIPGLVGSTLPDRFRGLIDRGATEVVTMDGLDNIPRLVALMPPSPGMPNMTLELGLSLTDAMRPVDRAAIRALAGFATVMLLSGGAAAWGVQQVVRARERATKAQRRMAQVLDSTTDAVFELDRQWRFTAMNDRAKTAVAAGRDLIGEVLWDALPEARAAAAWGRFHEAVATGAPVEYEARTAQGRWFAVRIFPTDEGLAVYSQDITARREAEEDRARLLADLAAGRRDLEAKQRLLEAVLRATPSGLIAVEGPSGRLLLRNDEAERLIGHPVFPAEGVRDYGHHGAIHADGTPYRPEDYPIARALRLGAEIRQEEMRYRRGDGQIVTLAVSTAPVRDETGRVGLAVSSFTDITARKAMEDDLRRSEGRLNLALEAAQAGNFEWDLEGGAITWSDHCCRLLGLDPDCDPPAYATWERIVHPDDLAGVLNGLRAAFAERRERVTATYRVLHPGGVLRWIMTVGRVAYRSDGTATRIVGLGMDVTERMATEAALRRSRERLAHALFSAKAGLWDLDMRSGEVVWSTENNTLFGLPAGTVASGYDIFLDTVVAEDRDACERMVREAVQARRREFLIEFRVRTPERGERWVAGAGQIDYDGQGHSTRMSGINIDITERKRMEDALRAAERRVRAVVEEAPVMMWVNHADGSFDFSNAVWRAYTGAAPSDGVRWEYVHPDDRPRVEQLRAGAIAAGNAYAFEMRLRRTDGAYRWHLGRVRPLVDDGRITAWIGTATDVHDLREAREEADRANVAKSKFLAAASHDLRQPLQSLFLFAAGLHGHVLDERGKRALTMLERNLDALKGLLESLLDVSRLDAAATRPDVRNVAVGPLLDEIGAAFGPIARAKGLAIEVDAMCPTIVRSDRNLLGRMVRNLVENAIKYTERGSVRLVCREDGDRAILEVVDTGIGIPAEQLNAVFEEFHQVDNPERDRHKGLGLGLSIVRRLSVILDHPVQVRSEPGRGSSFTVSIPLGTVDAEPPPPEAAVVPLGRGRLAVLVDDNADVLAGMRDMFLDWGFEVITAASAGEVEQRLGSNGGTPSVIVTDYRLGGDDDGFATIDRVRRRVGSSVPAVVLTGDTEADVHRSAIGRRAVLTIKPITAGQMNDALRRALGEGA